MPDQSPPAQPPTTAPPSRWTPQAVIGLLCLVAGVILRLAFEVDEGLAKTLTDTELAKALAEARTGLRIGDGLLLLGGSLLGWAPPLPALRLPGGGGSGPTTGLTVGLVLGTGAMLAGCAPRHVVAEQSVDVEIRRGPPCLIRVLADGELVARVDWSKRCEVALPEAVTP